jgi:nucleotide-binding universal stress UspA family protein
MFGKILVPVDGSGASSRAVHVAADLASRYVPTFSYCTCMNTSTSTASMPPLRSSTRLSTSLTVRCGA